MDEASVNLTKLVEMRAKMTPGVLEVCCADQPENHPCRLVFRDQDEPAFSLTRDRDEGRVPKADVAGIVATHNAADVLIGVARAALDHRDAHAALDAAERDELYVGVVSFSQLTGRDQHRELKETINKTGEALLSALAKVTL